VTLAEFSFASLQDKAKLGKRAVRRGQWRIKDQEFFRRLEELSSADLKTLPLVSRIQILNVLAQWNLLAGKKFTKQLEESLKPLSQWIPKLEYQHTTRSSWSRNSSRGFLVSKTNSRFIGTFD